MRLARSRSHALEERVHTMATKVESKGPERARDRGQQERVERRKEREVEGEREGESHSVLLFSVDAHTASRYATLEPGVRDRWYVG